MKETKTMRLKHSIQKKLMAATSMLMVAVIMMVSSTYAWFTLSTAPEVTGITTAVGANGNLEIALATKDTWAAPESISSGVDTSGDYTTWGNLIDVSDASYGLDDIVLMPSALNYDTTTKSVGSAMLKIPLYGADGRVDSLAADTVTGSYQVAVGNEEGKFVVNDDYGVRAVGTASAMTDRQIAYRNAKSALQSGSVTTKSKASASLANNGDALADIVIQRALNNADKFTKAQGETIGSVLTGLKEAIDSSKSAIHGAIAGLVASADSQNAGIDDTEYANIMANIDLDTITVDTATGEVTIAGQKVTLSTNLVNAITTYQKALTDYNAANTAYENIVYDETFTETVKTKNDDGTYTTSEVQHTNGTTWAEINAVLVYIVNQDKVTINDQTPSQFKANIGDNVSSVLTNGINVQLNEGSGIYYYLAELAGNFKTEVTLKNITAMGVTVAELPANMVTAVPSTQQAYFAGCISEIVAAGAPSAGAVTTDATITDVYGYAIDMFFRTNAANSNLLLRTSPTDRIYDENTNTESDTMGGGSTMTFTLTDTTFPLSNMVDLMGAIRVVFLEETNGVNNVLAYARLDMRENTVDGTTTTNYTVAGGGTEVTADLLLYTETTSTTVSDLCF